MTWSVPENGEVAMPASTEMLPLIVGENEVDEVEIVEDDPLEETAIVLPAGPAAAEA